MKSIAIIALFLLVSMPLKAQVWIDSGAVWHYDYGTISPDKGFVKLVYSADTVIQNQLCQKIEQYTFSFFDNLGTLFFTGVSEQETRYTYSSGDTVFVLHDNEFSVLYNFGALVGDTWVFSVDTGIANAYNDTSKIEVLAVDSVLLNGQYYRQIELGMATCGKYRLSGRFIERFGSYSNQDINYLFPVEFNCDTSAFEDLTLYSFKCFQDNSFELHNPSGQDCEYLLNILQVEETSKTNWTIYPNPAKGQITINIDGLGIADITIVGLLGGKVFEVENFDFNQPIDVSNFKSGTYIIRITTQSIIHTEKIVVF